ncbi:MAG: BatA domain-containing protein [Cyclobacteriaceae bacterium]
MSFAFPQFLWALSALSIPIIIHLFNFRRTTRIYFSNNRLLRQIKQETTQKRKLKRYLILASRLFFLFFLVMAFAQPFIPAKEQMNAARNIVIYLDNSFSMSAQVTEKTRALDAGTAFVREIAELFPPDTRYQFITNDFAPSANSLKTRTELLDLAAQVRLSPISRSAGEVLQRMKSGMSQVDVFWISDFQKSTIGEVNPSLLDSINQWHLVPVALGQSSNVYVDSVYLENPFVVGGEKNSVNVRLRNTGTRSSEGLVVKLVINNVQAGAMSVNLEPNSFVEASFDLTSGLSGLNEAKVSFTDFPVSFDNEFYFTLNFTETIKIVEIKRSAEPTYVERVFGNRQLFTYRGFEAGNVDYSALEQADLVVLNGLNEFGPGLETTIATGRSNYGALLLIPGESPQVNEYRQITGMPQLTWTDREERMDLDKPDFSNPFFENVFEERTTAIAMPQAARQLAWGADRSAVLKFRDGTPFLSQQGNLFLMSCPLNKSLTDFYTHALFVPVMYRIAAASKRYDQRPYYSLTNSLVTLRVDSLFGEEPLRLLGNQEIVPSQRRVGENVFLELPRFSINPGFYRVMNGSDTINLLAFNLDQSESELAQLDGNSALAQFGGPERASIFETGSVETFSTEIKERYLGTPLWKQALILALLFLLAEVLLIRFMK